MPTDSCAVNKNSKYRKNVNACPLECYDRSQDASLSISRSNREYMSSGENVRGDDKRGRGHMPRV